MHIPILVGPDTATLVGEFLKVVFPILNTRSSRESRESNSFSSRLS